MYIRAIMIILLKVAIYLRSAVKGLHFQYGLQSVNPLPVPRRKTVLTTAGVY